MISIQTPGYAHGEKGIKLFHWLPRLKGSISVADFMQLS